MTDAHCHIARGEARSFVCLPPDVEAPAGSRNVFFYGVHPWECLGCGCSGGVQTDDDRNGCSGGVLAVAISTLRSRLESNPLVGVGEIGLDYHYGTEFRKEQMEVLRLQLEFASAHDLPVNIHLRDATEDFIKVLEDCRHLHLRGNLHAFSGSAETFERVARTGDWYVALGGVLTFRNASIARDAVRIPLERILLETDAPYLAPTPLRGSRNESANIPRIAEFLAGIKGISVGEVARATTRNAVRLFPRIARKNEINIAH